MKRLALLVVGLVLAATPVRADIIVTTSGGRIVGKIVKETETEIQVKTDKGPIITLNRDEIDSITKEKPEDTFARMQKGVKGDDVKGLMALAQWARDNKLPKEAAETLERVIKYEPDHAEARVQLGYERVAGKWVKGDELQKAKGLVEYHGKWITPEDKSLFEAGYVKRGDRWVTKEEAECIDAGKPYNPYASGGGSSEPAPKPEVIEKPAKPDKPAKPEVAKPEVAKPEKPAKPEVAKPDKPAPEAPKPPEPKIDLPSDDKELMSIVLSTSKKPEERSEAFKALVAKGETQQAALKQSLGKHADDAKAKFLEHVKSHKGTIRQKMAALVLERRKAALMFIFDKTKYPDEDHGRVGQPEVDRLVGELRRAWSDPLRECMKDKSDKKLEEKLEEVQRTAGWLKELGVASDWNKTESELAVETNKLAGISDIGADGPDAQMLESSKSVLKWNETCKTSVTAEERECILVTNEYRMMFGLRALRIHEGLVQAARKHSKEMVEKNYFAHESPVPENASPGKRCAREGAKYTGENIAMGNTDGRSTFRQWYTSSGHHRNMLMRHRSIGIGNEANYWTEDFGADEPQ